MELDEKYLLDFQQLYKEVGGELSRAEAQEKGIKLLRIMELVCKSTNKNINKWRIE